MATTLSQINFQSPWFTLAPLFVINVIMLSTLLFFRQIYRKTLQQQYEIERHASKLVNRWFREYWLWLISPLVRFFIRHRVSPNTLTTIGVVFSLVSAICFWQGAFGLGGWMMIVSSTFDIFDGKVARESGQVTASGSYYDSTMDRVSEGLVFMGLILYYQSDWMIVLALLGFLGSFMVSYAKARGEACGVNYSGGSMQRPERIVYLGVGAIFSPLIAWGIGFYYPSITSEIVYLIPLGFVAIMTWGTSIHRIHSIMRLLNK